VVHLSESGSTGAKVYCFSAEAEAGSIQIVDRDYSNRLSVPSILAVVVRNDLPSGRPEIGW
jgi:hypothetical protein